MENFDVMDGTQSQMNIEPVNGGELMPVNQDYMEGPSGLEMAASVGLTMAIGYGIGKLGEFLWKKAIVPGYVKAVEWIDDKKYEKDEQIARKKAEKAEKEARKRAEKEERDARKKAEREEKEAARKKAEEDAVEADYEEVDGGEQPLPKKGMKPVPRNKRKH